MTSTSFNVGLGDGSRLSSRVLRPPGGGHTDIFGGEPEPPRTGRRPAQACVQSDEPAKPTNGAETPRQNGQAAESPQETAPQEAKPAPAPAPAKPAPAPAKPAPAQDKPDSPKAVTPTEPRSEAPKRVRVPPGGFSSGLW